MHINGCVYVIKLEHYLKDRHEIWTYMFFHEEGFNAIPFVVSHQQIELQYMFICRKLLNYNTVRPITMKPSKYIYFFSEKVYNLQTLLAQYLRIGPLGLKRPMHNLELQQICHLIFFVEFPWSPNRITLNINLNFFRDIVALNKCASHSSHRLVVDTLLDFYTSASNKSHIYTYISLILQYLDLSNFLHMHVYLDNLWS